MSDTKSIHAELEETNRLAALHIAELEAERNRMREYVKYADRHSSGIDKYTELYPDD